MRWFGKIGIRSSSTLSRGEVWRMVLATSHNAVFFKKRGFRMCVDDVAGCICMSFSRESSNVKTLTAWGTSQDVVLNKF